MSAPRQVSSLPRVCTAVALGVALAIGSSPTAQQPLRGKVTISASSTAELRTWGTRVDSMRRSGELRLRQTREDTLRAGRTHERLDQYHEGVRVFGADVARQLANGQVMSVFGVVHGDIEVDTSPALDAAEATRLVERLAGVELGPSRAPELVILPLEAGGYALTWRVRAVSRRGIIQYFLDADTGRVVFEYNDLKTQSAVGRGVGVLGDSKKVAASSSAGQFVASDDLRPPSINTYNLREDHLKVERYLNGVIDLSASDLASDSDNDWTDGAAVDAHVYAGWTYDYFFKRFARGGLDNRNREILSIVHPARRADVFTLFEDYSALFVNAGYYGDGIMIYGVGLPAGVTLAGQSWDHTSGALDIVAHELAHGVTDYSSNLIYQGEPGALNEAFSDIMGTSVEFFFQQSGAGPQRPDYVIGEDVVRPGGFRSMSDPGAFGDPDHYSRRYTGREDNGGVHINSGIANQAFYLAVEGGTNRTSGLSVQGVGSANREQIERIVYRAFTQLLPATATFSVARATTIQAARDLFGANSAAERAVTQAWTAVGVS